ncbi:MAG: 50S ribosomal protein L3 [Peptococcaceae bacterium]|jgi:large subunit ribosomal protein L3|nr:50S ribosomal protein L3 [Peptococcaceae bacterium]
MAKGILGRKVGMTQVYLADGRSVPVTVIEAGPCVVVQKKTPERDGYHAVQLGFGERRVRLVNKPVRGHLAKAGLKAVRYLREIRLTDAGAYEVGQEIKSDIFQSGERVDVTATSKGRGFAGGIKKHGFHRGPMAHGSKYHRRPGSLGAKGPARVFKGRKLPGHLGARRTTVLNLEVVRVDAARNLLAVKGAVPGPMGSLVVVREAVRAN